ncbi:hypothetical protein LUZ60_008288 [Juncus effusus]|nr:hypothetical protein LUZ60_008288 [Juncus effusus]
MEGGVGGPRKGRSFKLDDLTYSLYDHAFFEAKSLYFYIGKIVKIWEEQKMVEVVWFFHPEEIQEYLGDYRPLENEIFLACGTDDADGVYDLNRLETVAGKCKVVCTSRDARNPQPSEEDIARADFVFSRVFDVETKTLSEILPEKIALRDIRLFFNREEDLVRSSPVIPPLVQSPLPKPERKRPREDEKTDENGKSSKKRQTEIDKREISTQRGTKLPKEEDIRKERGKDDKEMGKVKENGGQDGGKDKEMGRGKENGGKYGDKGKEMGKGKGNIATGSEMRPPLPKRKETNGDLKNEKKLKVSIPVPAPLEDFNNEKRLESPVERRLESPVDEPARIDKRNWFKLSWDDKVEKAEQDGTLVFFENFDPTYLSSEIQEIIQRTTGQICIVKSVKNHSKGDLTYGEAYAIFQSREAANDVVYRLNKEFLILPDGRPLFCSKGLFKVPKKLRSLIGHFVIDKLKILMREEMKKAVSTSHCSQANTIEFDFAMDWFLTLDRYEMARSTVSKMHFEERKKSMLQK